MTDLVRFSPQKRTPAYATGVSRGPITVLVMYQHVEANLCVLAQKELIKQATQPSTCPQLSLPYEEYKGRKRYTRRINRDRKISRFPILKVLLPTFLLAAERPGYTPSMLRVRSQTLNGG